MTRLGESKFDWVGISFEHGFSQFGWRLAETLYSRDTEGSGGASKMSAVPLIVLQGDKFVVHEEGAKKLTGITNDVAVIAIAGLYR